MTKTMICSVLSALLPLLVYAFLLLPGGPDGLKDGYTFIVLLSADAAGLLLSLVALSRSNIKPINISPRMRIMVTLGSIGIFLNTVLIEYVLAHSVFSAVRFPPPGT